MQLRVLAATLASVGLFTACGGGGSSDGGTPGGGDPGPGTGITLTGVVAGGAALPGAAVSVQCATGSGSATAGSDGGYSVTISNGALPCVLTGTSGSTAFHSVAPTGTTVANITPLTELLVAQLTGQDPATFASSASGATLTSTVTAGAINSAQTSLETTLAAAGVDVSAITNFVSSPLVAANGNTSGNTYDQLLDQLNTQLQTAGTTLAAVTTTVATTAAAASGGGGTTTEPASTGTALLPSELLMATKASNCATLASGTYRVIKLAPSVGTNASDPVTAIGEGTLDAATLTWTMGADSWNWTPTGNCRYTDPDGADIVVAPSGLLVARVNIGTDDTTVNASARGTARLVIGMPMQTHAATEMAGTWDMLSATFDMANYLSTAVTFTADGNGALTSVLCDNDEPTGTTNCSTGTANMPTFESNADGGLDIVGHDPQFAWRDRMFVFRSGTGDLLGLALSPDGSWFVATKHRTRALPTVGATNANWSLLTNSAGVAQAVTANSHVIDSVDANNSSFSRTTTDQATHVSMPQTLVHNAPRDGYTHRLSAAVTASDGSAQTVREGWFLGLKNTGLTAIYLPATSNGTNARFGLSVEQPQ